MKEIGSFKIIEEKDDGTMVCEMSNGLKEAIKKVKGWKRLTSKRFSNLVAEGLEMYIQQFEIRGK